MERQEVFILLKKKTFRHDLKLYFKGIDGKLEQRIVTFTTSHLVSEKGRATSARTKNAEYITSDERIIDALYRDSGYGIRFVHRDDLNGERKRDSFNVTPLDASRLALRNLFNAIGLEFDESKSNEVLTKEYQIHVSAKAGVDMTQSTAREIPHTPIDVQKSLQDQIDAARNIYQERYGSPVPDEFYNDVAFLSALSDPKWDAQAYISANTTVDEDPPVDPPQGPDEEGLELPDTPEELWPIYKEATGKNVPNPKKNDAAWMKKAILEKRAN